MAATNKQAQIDLDLNGRQIKHHLAAADRHERGVTDHNKSAAMLLIECKRSLKHGEWLPWLDKHGIGEQRAQRLIFQNSDPQAEKILRERKAERDDKRTADAKASRDRMANPSRHQGFAVDNSDYPEPKPKQITPPEYTEVVRISKTLTAEKLRLVINYINTL